MIRSSGTPIDLSEYKTRVKMCKFLWGNIGLVKYIAYMKAG